MPTWSTEVLQKWRWQWYFLASDRAGEFDAMLRRPFRNLDVVRTAMRDHLAADRTLSGTLTPEELFAPFRHMLDTLDRRGEDTKRIFAWWTTLSLELAYRDPEVRDLTGAFSTWQTTLGYWSRGRHRPVSELVDTLAASYSAKVSEPLDVLKRELGSSETEWLTTPSRRSSFDDLLWEAYLEDVYLDPGIVVMQGLSDAMTRDWWRGWSPRLSDDDKAALFAAHVDATYAFDGDIVKTANLVPIDEAMILDRVPAFDAVAAPRGT